ncbi:MAG: ArnT family glycosyltransferase [Chthonomonadales bacterium]
MKRAPQPVTPTDADRHPHRRTQGMILAAILGLYALFSACHAVVTPVAPDAATNYINAPDEAAHLAYVRSLALGKGLPTPSGPFATYEWHQPPLYYLLAAPLFRFGPHAVRGLSILLGLFALVCLFLFARTLDPGSPETALFATGLAAFLPMRQAVYGAANNDALTELCFTLTLLLCIRIVAHGLRFGQLALLGIVLGASFLAKSSALLLAPVTAAAVVLAGCRHHASPKGYLLGFSSLVLAAIISLPWLHHMAALTGEVIPLHTFHQEFAGTMRATNFLEGRGFAADLWSGTAYPAGSMGRAEYLATVANWTFRTFFGAYTPPGRPARLGIPYFMPPQFYLLFALIGLTGALGWVRLLAAKGLKRQWDPGRLLPAILLIALVVGAFGAFVWVYFQAQGRYLYPALAPMSTLLAMGVSAVVPRARQAAAFIGITALLILLSAAFLMAGALPAYSAAPPAPPTPA